MRFLFYLKRLACTGRLDKLRGGPPRVPSRGPAWVTSARAVPTHTALASERNALRRHPSADDLLRRIERHFDANGSLPLSALRW